MAKSIFFDNLDGAKGIYSWATKDGGLASGCIECGSCEEACPQHIKIIDELRKAAELLEVR